MYEPSVNEGLRLVCGWVKITVLNREIAMSRTIMTKYWYSPDIVDIYT